jgi:hypothetical protein
MKRSRFALVGRGILALAFAASVLIGSGQASAADFTVGTPIVKYYGGPSQFTDAVMQQAVDGGFNVIGAGSTADLDRARTHGLRAHLLYIPDDVGIMQIRNHPALYSYELADEPSASQFPSLGATVQHVRDLDPGHLVYINLFPSYASNAQLGTSGNTVTAYNSYLNQFINTVRPSLISYDHFHFLSNGTDGNQYFLNLKLVADAARQAGLPFMQVVQGYAVTPGYRTPTPGELRFLSFTTQAYGADGINYFRYPEALQEPRFTALQSINRQFEAIGEQVQPLEWIGAYHLGDQPPGTVRLPANSPFTITPSVPDTTYVNGSRVKGLVMGLFGPDVDLSDAQQALVVNLDYLNNKSVTVVGPGALSVFDVTTGAWSPTGSDQATLNLLPGGGTLVGLTSSVPEPSAAAAVSIFALSFLGCRRRGAQWRSPAKYVCVTEFVPTKEPCGQGRIDVPGISLSGCWR